MSNTVSYTVNGKKQTGYIKDGKTYTDNTYTSRVPTGAIVHTKNGDYTMTDSGGAKHTSYNAGGYNKTGYEYGGKVYTDPTLTKVASPSAGAPMNKSSATKVGYTVGGKTQTGFLKDGRAYTDAGLTTRVPVGAVVHTEGGDYAMTADEGAATPQTIINDYNKGVAGIRDNLNSARLAEEARINANTQAALNRLNAQKREVEKNKELAEREAYSAYRNATNPYGVNAQQIASLGLGGSGFSETNLASLGSEYQASIAKAVEERNRALNDISLAIEEARLSGDLAKAEALSTYATNLANMDLSVAQNRASIQSSLSQNAIANTKYLNELNYAREQDKRNAVLAAISAGFVPTGAAEILGVPQYVLDAYAAAQLRGWGTYKTGGSSGGELVSDGGISFE